MTLCAWLLPLSKVELCFCRVWTLYPTELLVTRPCFLGQPVFSCFFQSSVPWKVEGTMLRSRASADRGVTTHGGVEGGENEAGVGRTETAPSREEPPVG